MASVEDYEALRAHLRDQDGDGHPSLRYGGGDCDDADPDVSPDSVELCDEIDNDCDGLVDASASDAPTWYLDRDEDGYGDDAEELVACEGPAGYVTTSGDCDDQDASVNPGAQERCASGDENCDGQEEEGEPLGAKDWWPDEDEDGFGDAGGAPERACSGPEGWVDNDADCDDQDGLVHPDAIENCGDGIDNNCDGGAAGCGLFGELDAGDAQAVLEATSEQDGVGESATCIGDVDGDGLGELAVGSIRSLEGPSASGAVYVLRGPVIASTVLDDSDRIWPGTMSDHIGSHIVPHADVDRDGLGDLVASGESIPGAGEDRGVVHVLLEPMGELTTFDEAYLTFRGEAREDTAGTSVSLITAQDEVSQMVVGAPGVDDGGDGAGAVYGLATSETGAVGPPDAVWVITGTSEGGGLGRAMASPGDLDGDGLDDLVVAAPGASDGQLVVGAVHVFLAPHVTLFSSAADLSLYGQSSGEELGTSISAVGDWDGDGRPEVAIGAPGRSDVYGEEGEAYVLPGTQTGHFLAADLAVVSLYGSAGGDHVGDHVLGPGDVDGDGAPDLVVTVPAHRGAGSEAGLVAVLAETRAGRVDVLAADGVIRAGSSGGSLGASLGAGCDQDGDGQEDLLVGSSELSAATPQLGGVYLFLGGGL